MDVEHRLDLLLQVDPDGGPRHDAQVGEDPRVLEVGAGPRQHEHLLVVAVLVHADVQQGLDHLAYLLHSHPHAHVQRDALAVVQAEDQHGVGHTVRCSGTGVKRFCKEKEESG